MAANVFTGTVSSSWNNAGNWSLGSIPTVSDGHIVTFDATSPNCTLGGNFSCNHLDMTGYTNTFSVGSSVFLVNGNITIVPGFSQNSGGTLNLSSGGGNMTSNGVSIPGLLWIQGGTRTLIDDWTTNDLRLGTTGNPIINDNVIHVTGDLAHVNNTNITGTTEIVMTGTGSITSSTTLSFSVRLNLTINTTGIVTIGNFRYGGGTFRYVAGTVSCSGNFVVVNANTTLDVNGSTFPNSTTTNSIGINFDRFTLTGGLVLFLTTPICVVNSFSWGGGVGNIRTSGIYLLGDFVLTGNCTSNNTTSILYMKGNGQWIGNFVARIDIVFDTTGTITFSDNIQFAAYTITYISGHINARNSSLSFAANSSIFNFDKIKIGFITATAAVTITANRFFIGDVHTNILVGDSSNRMTFELSQPCYSDFIALLNVSFSNANGYYKPVITNRNSNKGGNINVIFENQLPNGFPQKSLNF